MNVLSEEPTCALGGAGVVGLTCNLLRTYMVLYIRVVFTAGGSDVCAGADRGPPLTSVLFVWRLCV